MEEVITYIKNDTEEKTVKVNKFNKRKIREKLFESTNKYINIKPDINYIHFINVDLTNLTNLKESSTRIRCDHKTMCILEDCILNELCTKYSLLGDCFQLINFNPKKTTKVKPNYCSNLIIDNSKVKNPKRNIDISTFDGCKKVELKDNETVKELYLNCDDITLTGIFLLDTFTARSDNKLKIGNEKEETKIIMTDEKYPLITIESDKLELNNCTIINDSTCPTHINYRQLNIKNFTIKSKGKIVVNYALMYQIKKDKDGYYILTDKDLLRLELTGLLKHRLEQIKKQIKKQTKEYLSENKNEKLISNIERQKQIIKREQELLAELLEEQNQQEQTKQDNITKSLTKKRIRYFK